MVLFYVCVVCLLLEMFEFYGVVVYVGVVLWWCLWDGVVLFWDVVLCWFFDEFDVVLVYGLMYWCS